MNCIEKLDRAVRRNNSCLCVGLDTDFAKIPRSLRQARHPLAAFNKAIIDATADKVCAYKINIAFYETNGWKGLRELEKTLDRIPKDIPVILDAKRGDIGNTTKMYAASVFDHYKADAVTVNPYMGLDAVRPFLEYRDRLTIVLCLTSNPSARQFQMLPLKNPLYKKVAKTVGGWHKEYGNCAMVVGATKPVQLAGVRRMVPDMYLLIPGVGAQQGDTARVVRAGRRKDGGGMIINSSRGIIYASGGSGFAEAAAREADRLRRVINEYR